MCQQNSKSSKLRKCRSGLQQRHQTQLNTSYHLLGRQHKAMFPSANVILSRAETKILERLFIKLKSYKIHYDISAKTVDRLK